MVALTVKNGNDRLRKGNRHWRHASHMGVTLRWASNAPRHASCYRNRDKPGRWAFGLCEPLLLPFLKIKALAPKELIC